ncbi:MAG: hypothetical protein PHF11_03150 [Candidatus Omnitrophica bacterium]|nr:hypothetical protein [Candidatus Omnitrophota bacterium]
MLIVAIVLVCVVIIVTVSLFLRRKTVKIKDVDTLSKDRSGRIDIYSQDMEFELIDVKAGGTLKARCDYAHWLDSKDQQKHWFAEGGVGSEWENLWIEFTPSASGYLFINLRGSFYDNVKHYHHDVWVDDCQLEGGALRNGDFEMIDPDSKPAYWSWNGSKDRYSTDGSQAHSGQCCVLIWHDIPLLQRIEVRAQKRYKVSAWFKAYALADKKRAKKEVVQ